MKRAKVGLYYAYVGLRDAGTSLAHWEAFLCDREPCQHCEAMYACVIFPASWDDARAIAARAEADASFAVPCPNCDGDYATCDCYVEGYEGCTCEDTHDPLSCPEYGRALARLQPA